MGHVNTKPQYLVFECDSGMPVPKNAMFALWKAGIAWSGAAFGISLAAPQAENAPARLPVAGAIHAHHPPASQPQAYAPIRPQTRPQPGGNKGPVCAQLAPHDRSEESPRAASPPHPPKRSVIPTIAGRNDPRLSIKTDRMESFHLAEKYPLDIFILGITKLGLWTTGLTQ
jgi:hypothetical protein